MMPLPVPVIAVVAGVIALRLVEAIRYRHLDIAEQQIASKRTGSLIKRSDIWIELATFACVWLEIILMFQLGAYVPPLVAAPLVAALVAGRLRALQEIGHSALHLGFGDHRRLQWMMADWLGNFWLFKANSKTRFKSHCIEHHRNANTEADPNIKRLRRLGFVPGMAPGRFERFLFHPLSPAGITETLSLYSSILGVGLEPVIRGALLAAIILVLGTAFGPWAPATWLLALVVFYPLYSWWSLLAEHRWFAVNGENAKGHSHQCEVTPRTLYSGFERIVVRYLISPCTDSLHLAHHIHPRLHWRYLPIADRLLERDASYAKHTKTTLFGPSSRSVIGDLRRRMTA